MTQAEYLAQREKLVKQLSKPETVSGPVGSITYRSTKDVIAAITALDAEWQASQKPAPARIGRVYGTEGL